MRIVARVISLLTALVLALALDPGMASAESPADADCADQVPCLVLSPDQGTAGTVVRISGRITEHRSAWRDSFRHPGTMRLGRAVKTPDGVCGLTNSVADPAISMDRRGRVRGHFTVTDEVTCRYGLTPPESLAGDYYLFVGCQACQVAVFHRTDEQAELPFTGSTDRDLLGIALAALVFGSTLLRLGRRQRIRHDASPDANG